MKKILTFAPSRVLIFCGIGLLMTLGAFWHHQTNMTQLERMNVLNQGISTCFNRISQTFTAVMIKDVQSPYLNREFMALSDECLNETIKGINPFRQQAGKGYEMLNKLISDVHWFHEKVLKTHGPMLAGQKNSPVNGLSDKFSKLEDLKVGMVDQIENDSSRLRGVQTNDEFLMGAGLIIFVIALSLLSLQEFNRIQLQREIEREALNLLRAGQSNVGAMVDRLVDRALLSQSMPVTAQIFRDYHEELLERMSSRPAQVETRAETKTENVTPNEAEVETQATGPRTSLKEVLVSLQNVHPADMIQLTEVRDVQLAVNFESFEQMMNSAVNKLNERRVENKKIMITNQIHSDRSVISLFVAGTTFTATELEFAASAQNAATDGIDMNLFILKEMVAEAGAQWHLENKTDRIGAITGMNIRFVVNRAPKENKSKLVSVMRGKKKDLSRELMN